MRVELSTEKEVVIYLPLITDQGSAQSIRSVRREFLRCGAARDHASA